MPISLSLEPLPHGRSLAIVRMSGRVSPADLKAFNDDLYRSGTFDPAWPMLIDVRALDQPASREEADQIATDLGQLPDEPGSRRAVVADQAAYFGVSRMLTTRSSLRGARADTHVFQSYDEALRWASQEGETRME